LLPGNSDLYVAHDTWGVYGSMLRIIKYYDFAFHELPSQGSAIIPGHAMSFSSYPGMTLDEGL
jgi:hypothetical protein